MSLVQFIEESPRNQGIWVVYKCNGKCNLLLDPCATNSIPSDRLHAEIIKPVKMNFTQRIVKAELDTQKLCCKVGEAIAIVDRSLGLDFLESYKCLIDGFWKRMYVQGLEHNLELYKSSNCYLIGLCKTIQVEVLMLYLWSRFQQGDWTSAAYEEITPSRKIKGSDEVPQSGTFHLESLHQEKLMCKRIGRKIHPGDFSFRKWIKKLKELTGRKTYQFYQRFANLRQRSGAKWQFFYCQRSALEKNLQKIDEETQTDEVQARKIHVKIIRGIIKF